MVLSRKKKPSVHKEKCMRERACGVEGADGAKVEWRDRREVLNSFNFSFSGLSLVIMRCSVTFSMKPRDRTTNHLSLEGKGSSYTEKNMKTEGRTERDSAESKKKRLKTQGQKTNMPARAGGHVFRLRDFPTGERCDCFQCGSETRCWQTKTFVCHQYQQQQQSISVPEFL